MPGGGSNGGIGQDGKGSTGPVQRRKATFSLFGKNRGGSGDNNGTAATTTDASEPSTLQSETAPTPSESIPSLPSLPSLQLSSAPYRMSWSFGNGNGNGTTTSNGSSPSTSPAKPRRPHTSNGPTPDDWLSNVNGEGVDALGLGIGGSGRASPRRRSTLTRIGRSNSDSSPPNSASITNPIPRSYSSTTLSDPSSPPPPLPIRPPPPLKQVSDPSEDLLSPNIQSSAIARSGSSTALATSPSASSGLLSFAPRSSISSRRPTSSSGASGVFGAVTGFFGNNSTSSNALSASAMSRSSSTNSALMNGKEVLGSTPPPNDFGALFDKSSKSNSSPRKRGLSVGAGVFGHSSSSGNRRRAGSSSSLSTSWIPPGGTMPTSYSTTNGSSSLLVPGTTETLSTSGGSSNSISLLGRTRANTDPRRFSLSSNNSNHSPIPSPGVQQSPPASPTLFRRSSFLNSRTSVDSPTLFSGSGSRKQSFTGGSQLTAEPKVTVVKAEAGEDGEDFLERVKSVVSSGDIARVLASSAETTYSTALSLYLSSFEFTADPLDIALRKFLMEASLPTETQQIDRVMECFANRYNQCNIGLFKDADTPYVLAFSLVLLSSDQFNPSNKHKMTKSDYIRNTRIDGVATEVLEYFFDQICITPFVFVEDDNYFGQRTSDLASSTSTGFFSKASTSTKDKAKIDPYHMIVQGQTKDLRVDVEARIPTKSPFSFTGTTSFFDVSLLHRAFTQAPILQITSRSRSKSTVGDGAPLTPISSITTFAPPAEKGAVSSLKVTKIGLLSRKEDLVEGGKKSSSRKWKGWSVILTGSQLLFFKDASVATSLQHTIHDALRQQQHKDSSPIVIAPPQGAFKPDAVLSLANSAAIYDSTYTKYDNVFRLVAPAGRQYLFQARDTEDLNSWLAHINYAASFKTANLRMRPLHSGERSSTVSPSSSQPPSSPALSRPSTMSSFPKASTLTEQSFPESSLGSVPPFPEADATLPASLRAALRESGALDDGTTPMPRKSPNEFGEYPFPRSAPNQPGETSRPPETRVEILRLHIAELEEEIATARTTMRADLCQARNLAVLTPFRSSTRERIVSAISPLEKRIRQDRMSLAKLICHYEVLTRDLIVEDRQSHRTRKSSTRRSKEQTSSAGPSFRSSQTRVLSTSSRPWLTPSESLLLPEVVLEEDHRPSFESGGEQFAASLTDDELDRLRSPPLMQRSHSEFVGARPRAVSTGEDDELAPMASTPMGIPTAPLSPAASTTSLTNFNRPSPSVRSFPLSTDLAPSEGGSVDDGVSSPNQPDLPSTAPPSTKTSLEETQPWQESRIGGKGKRVSVSLLNLEDQEAGAGISTLMKIREERRSEGAGDPLP